MHTNTQKEKIEFFSQQSNRVDRQPREYKNGIEKRVTI